MNTGFPNKIAISRTDSIGDVVVTLPLCGYIKTHFPETKIVFVGKEYTRAVIESCQYVDEFYNFDTREAQTLQVDAIVFAFPDKTAMKWAKSIHIPIRVATANRLHSWIYANKRVFFSRKQSPLHESQLNFFLLRFFDSNIKIPEIETLSNLQTLLPTHKSPISINPNKHSVIFHMLSKGSAKNWSMQKFEELAEVLDPKKFDIYLTGTENEGSIIRKTFPRLAHVHDITGKLSLHELIAFISSCQLIVAASTGPLHIAAGTGVHAVGLYPCEKPMHAGRWAPLG
ncbi:MAG: glycosyltransferase family 9 protein, partial [Bacteroidota bacterium]